jgi:hypothetical protein
MPPIATPKSNIQDQMPEPPDLAEERRRVAGFLLLMAKLLGLRHAARMFAQPALNSLFNAWIFREPNCGSRTMLGSALSAQGVSERLAFEIIADQKKGLSTSANKRQRT